MISTRCTECGSTFYREPDETWKRRCLSCWKATKGTTKARSYDQADECLRWYQRGLEDGRKEAPAQIPFDRDRLRQLLQLCHPDKHGGSDLAQRVTQWLNEIKRGVPA